MFVVYEGQEIFNIILNLTKLNFAQNQKLCTELKRKQMQTSNNFFAL